MRVEEVALRLNKLSKNRSLTYSLADPASAERIRQAEQLLGVSFPAQVRLFYCHFNGLKVHEPHLEVLPLERLRYAVPNYLHFATFNGDQHVHFDVSHTNEAEQWNIVASNGYQVTLTMASFWSNKIFAWIERRRPIWKDEFWKDEATGQSLD